MLLNFSNHPYETWSEKQQKTANMQFGKIRNLPFPSIPPEWNMEEVESLANTQILVLLEVCKQEIYEQKLAILLSGEQSFLIAFYQYARKYKIPCYVATSERNTVMNEDGSKTVQFDFVQFRKI